MFPTSVKEVEALGWDYIDVILVTGDAFADHPSFGTACIGRWLQHFGYRVAVVPQPNWRDDLRDFRKLGAPRLYFGVNVGAMDSMVNHYEASLRCVTHYDYWKDELLPSFLEWCPAKQGGLCRELPPHPDPGEHDASPPHDHRTGR